MTEYFLICTASSDRQMKAVLEGIEEDLRKEGTRPIHVEGEQGSGWILADYGSIFCHVFKPEERAFYGLEELWSGAKTVVRMQ